MKILLPLLLISLSLFFSNRAIASKPEKIAKKFLTAICTGDYKTAAKYCTEQTKGYMDKLALEHPGLIIQTPQTFTIIDSEKTRASAEVEYQVTGESDTRKLKLVQFKDGWQVQFEQFALRWCIPE